MNEEEMKDYYGMNIPVSILDEAKIEYNKMCLPALRRLVKNSNSKDKNYFEHIHSVHDENWQRLDSLWFLEPGKSLKNKL